MRIWIAAVVLAAGIVVTSGRLTWPTPVYGQDAATNTTTTTVVSAPAGDTTTVSAPGADTVVSTGPDTTVSAPTADTVVSIDVRSLLNAIIDNIAPVLLTLLAAALTFLGDKLPFTKPIVVWLRSQEADKILAGVVQFAIGVVRGATAKLDTWDINVGNKVFAEALQFAVNTIPGWVITFFGGYEGLRIKILGLITPYLAPDVNTREMLAANPVPRPGSTPVGPEPARIPATP